MRFFKFAIATLCAIAAGEKSAIAELTDSQREEASALFKEYSANADDFDARFQAVEKLVEMGRDVSVIFYNQIHPGWRQLRQKYQADFSKAAAALAKSHKSGAVSREIANHRSTLRRLREAKNLTKEMLQSEGVPALNYLRDLAVIDVEEVLQSNPQLTQTRAEFLAITTERALTFEKMPFSKETRFDEEDLIELEEEMTRSLASGGESEDLAILARNAQIADQVEPSEAAGISDLNEMRMLMGLRPVVLDPKLTAASRGHSQDMAEHDFFDHTSPVKGKESPWDRARLEGTSASAENIFIGSEDPKSANRAWFVSPGHHKNMFGDHNRGGMGNYGRLWTQMFGK